MQNDTDTLLWPLSDPRSIPHESSAILKTARTKCSGLRSCQPIPQINIPASNTAGKYARPVAQQQFLPSLCFFFFISKFISKMFIHIFNCIKTTTIWCLNDFNLPDVLWWLGQYGLPRVNSLSGSDCYSSIIKSKVLHNRSFLLLFNHSRLLDLRRVYPGKIFYTSELKWLKVFRGHEQENTIQLLNLHYTEDSPIFKTKYW